MGSENERGLKEDAPRQNQVKISVTLFLLLEPSWTVMTGTLELELLLSDIV